jgi:hypothetical protein
MLDNCRIHLPSWFAEFLRKHEPDGLSLRSLQQFSKLESLVRMIKSIVSIAFATALIGSVAFAQTSASTKVVPQQPTGMTETTTSTTESTGTVTEFTPGDSLTLKTEATEPMHYTFSKNVTYMNAHGKVIGADRIKKDSKVQVHYLKHGNKMVVDKVTLTHPRH